MCHWYKKVIIKILCLERSKSEHKWSTCFKTKESSSTKNANSFKKMPSQTLSTISHLLSETMMTSSWKHKPIVITIISWSLITSNHYQIYSSVNGYVLQPTRKALVWRKIPSTNISSKPTAMQRKSQWRGSSTSSN